MTVNLLDINYYRAVNPDLAAAGVVTDAQLVEHFVNAGANEGRRFSAFVNLDLYRAINPDLAAAGINNNLQAFYHLQSSGIAEGRRFSMGFNAPFYRVVNPDLAAAGINNNEIAFEHFRANGLNEGRLSAENFNVRFYLDANADLRAAGFNFGQAFTHYVTNGYREGRPAIPGSTPTPTPPPPPPVEPGNTPATALNVDVLTGTRTFNDFVGSTDRDDYYRFSLTGPSDFSLSLSNLSDYAQARLYVDINGNGRIDSDETLDTAYGSSFGNGSISKTLGPATYFVDVYTTGSSYNTNYTLSLSATATPPTTPRDPGNTTSTALDLGTLGGTRTFNDFVGSTDRDDFYRFVLSSARNFNLSLSGLTDYAQARLYVDINGNGRIDSDETLDTAYGSSFGNGSISKTLGPATYFVDVYTTGSSYNTNYTLGLSA